MFIAKCKVKSLTPISFSKKVLVPKEDHETAAQHEERTWKSRCHINGRGNVVIPSTFFTGALREGAKLLNKKVVGGGNNTYTKHFLVGARALNEVDLGVTPEQVNREDLFVPSDGMKGGGKRVDKTFPVVHEWEGTIKYLVTDDKIDPTTFKEALINTGINVGLGRFRPRNGGDKGMFKVVGDIEYTQVKDAAEIQTAMT